MEGPEGRRQVIKEEQDNGEKDEDDAGNASERIGGG